MVEVSISSYYQPVWRCFHCRERVFTLKNPDDGGDCVTWGIGRFLCLPCKAVINQRRREELAAKKQRDEQHWQDIGNLNLAEGN